MATKQYLAEGRDGYDMLKDAQVVVSHGKSAARQVHWKGVIFLSSKPVESGCNGERVKTVQLQ